jgi:hypothetical protein
MMFSRKRKHGEVIIYAGVDPESRTDAFLAKCDDCLCYLQEHDNKRYDLFVKHIGRILGSGSYSNFYSFPRIIEVNHSDVLSDSAISMASLIVGYTTYAQHWKQLKRSDYTMDEIHRLCLKEEAQFQEKITGNTLSELEILKLKQKRFMPRDLSRAFMKRALSETLGNLKKK